MYVVAGSLGHTGSIVVRRLIERGQEVCGLVSRESRAAELDSIGARPVVVNFNDRRGMTEALQGAKAAYLLNPPDLDRKAAAELSAGLATAVKESGIPHVVFLSSIGAQYRTGTGAALPLYDAERIMREAVNSIVFVRPATFMEYLRPALEMAAADSVFPTAFSGFDNPRHFVSCRDIGQVAADALLDPLGGERIIELVGPTDYSLKDVVGVAGRVLGRTIEPTGMRTEQLASTLISRGMSADYAKLVAELYDWYNAGYPAMEQHDDRPDSVRLRGTVTIEDVFRDFLG